MPRRALLGDVGTWSEMSNYQLTPEQEPLDHDTRQPALWASLIAFIVINNLAIFARIWIKWGTNLNRKKMTAEDIFVRGLSVPVEFRSYINSTDDSQPLRLPLTCGDETLTVDGSQQIILSGVSKTPLKQRCETFSLINQLDICECSDSKPHGSDSLRSGSTHLQCELERFGIPDEPFAHFQGKSNIFPTPVQSSRQILLHVIRLTAHARKKSMSGSQWS